MQYPRTSGDITFQLDSLHEGTPEAISRLMTLVYGDLRRIAAGQLRRERANHTWQPTDLVHEAYPRLIDLRRIRFNNRTHFFAMAARVMYRVLIDHARARDTLKRQGGERLPIEEARVPAPKKPSHEFEFEKALKDLAKFDRVQATLVELHYVEGCSINETALRTGMKKGTVRDELAVATAWLRRAMTGGGHDR